MSIEDAIDILDSLIQNEIRGDTDKLSIKEFDALQRLLHVQKYKEELT